MGIVTCHLVRDINSQIPIIAMLNWYSYLSFGGIRQLQWAHRLVALGIATCHLAGYVNDFGPKPLADQGIATCHLAGYVNIVKDKAAQPRGIATCHLAGYVNQFHLRELRRHGIATCHLAGYVNRGQETADTPCGIATCHLAGYVNQVVGISTLKNTKILLLRQTKKLVNQHLPLTRRYCGPHRQGYTGFDGTHTSPSPQRCLIRTRRAADLWSIRRCLCIPAYRSLAAEAY